MSSSGRKQLQPYADFLGLRHRKISDLRETERRPNRTAAKAKGDGLRGMREIMRGVGESP